MLEQSNHQTPITIAEVADAISAASDAVKSAWLLAHGLHPERREDLSKNLNAARTILDHEYAGLIQDRRERR